MKKKCTFDQTSVPGRPARGTRAWVFDLHRDGSFTTFNTWGTWSRAKAEAMREARSLGCMSVTVASAQGFVREGI